MNWLDVFIILFLLAALIRGTEVGFTRQFFSTFGFFTGLFIGAMTENRVIHLVYTPGKRALLALVMTLGFAIIGMIIGEYVGWRLKFTLQRAQLADKLDRILGAALAGVTLLAAVWLGTAIFRGMPDGLWQRQIRGSRIVSGVNSILPSAPGVLTNLGHLIDPNGFPQVFTGVEPEPAKTEVTLPDIGELNDAIQKDHASVVKIEGKGCGGIVEGSGFVAANNRVLTNAHVVAGVEQPFVIDGNGTHQAKVVSFDPDLDVAVLSTDGLFGGPLKLATENAPNGTAVAMLGYPGGNALSIGPGTILDSFEAVGHNIYNKGQTKREVYSVKMDVQAGNSGGPMIGVDGTVIGMVFAKSTSYDQIGYALTLDKVAESLDKASSKTAAVNTGKCAE